MDLFAFASLSETQGIVLTEAMAAGVPVVAIDSPGVREVVKDGYNGCLLANRNRRDFIEAVKWCLCLPPMELQQLKRNARLTAGRFDIRACAKKMLALYTNVVIKDYIPPNLKDSNWRALIDRLASEWDLFKNMMHAGGAAISEPAIVNITVKKKIDGVAHGVRQLLKV